MRDAEGHTLYSHLLRNFRCLPRDRQRRTPARLPHHFQIHPFHPAPPPRPQRLHRRLFRREPPRVPLIFILEPLAILPFPRRIHAPQKYFSMALDRPLNPLHLGNVHPHSHDHAALLNSCALSGLAETVRAFVVAGLWTRPIFSSFNFGASRLLDITVIVVSLKK